MIIDSIANIARYRGIFKRIDTALRYLAQTDFSTVDPGRFDIDGDNIYALVQEYDTKLIAESKWETHEKYTDVQFIAAGSEQIGFADTSALTPLALYDESKDVTKFEGSGDFVTLKPGWFAVFFAGEAHMPCVAIGVPDRVRKVVVKVRA